MRKPIDPKLFAIYYEPETCSIIAQQHSSNKRKVVMEQVEYEAAVGTMMHICSEIGKGRFKVDFESGCIGE